MRQLTPKQREALKLVAEGRFVPGFEREDDGWHARWHSWPENPWVDEYVRSAAVTPLSADAEDQRHETLHDAWATALRSRTGLVVWDDAECAQFADELKAWSGDEAENSRCRKAIVFRLDPVASRVTCAVPRNRLSLRALGQATFVWGKLRELHGRRTLKAALSRAEAEDFVRRGARDLRNAGYTVEGDDLSAAVTAAAEVRASERENGSAPEFRLTVKVAGEPVTAAELRFLLEQGSSLVFFRNRWIEVDRNLLKEALRALERQGGPSAVNPLAFVMGIGAVGQLEVDEVAAHGWLRGLVNELRQGGGGQAAAYAPPPDFLGELRAYQRRGAAWLRFLTDHGFGALLADDMGLGKTVQVIAWLLSVRAAAESWAPCLVVAPLTLLVNWQREIARFAPGLRVYVHQGEERHVASGFLRAARAADVVVTSYNLLVREQPAFAEVAWSALVVDEAQAMKNPDTRLFRALKALSPPRRIALTGTPIENSVADLWALEDFLNPGFLGDRRSFEDRFVRPLAADPMSRQGARLRHALEPFVLRRTKGDPDVAAELGEKREIREYCALGGEERAEYESALQSYRVSSRRQGDVFALLTELKLICDGFVDDGIGGGRVRGSKVELLAELAGRIFAGGESLLVFTQYAKVGRALQKDLESRFGRRFPFLHGGLTAKAREEQIRTFNAVRGPNLFILSLKAGGFGLNLTKATHVLHYDRWWNPAVENQATDRAHRIGQSRAVFVHEFIVAGTLEEHVDDILRRKQSLAGVIADGEAFARLVALN